MGGLLCSSKNEDYTGSGLQSNDISVLVIGDKQVGKDCLIAALLSVGKEDSNSEIQKMQYKQYPIRFHKLKKNEPTFFQLFVSSKLKQCQVVLICVDLSNTATMQNFSDTYLEKIIEQVTATRTINLRVILVGCKADKKARSQSEEEELSKFAKDINIPFIRVSAEKQINIQELLEDILKFKNQNITVETVGTLYPKLQNSRYVDIQSQLRNNAGSLLSHHPTYSEPGLQAVLPRSSSSMKKGISKCDNSQSQQAEAKEHLPDEESKMESRSSVQQSHSLMYGITPYIRIIPSEKMLHPKRVQLDKGNFGVVYKIDLEGEECALKICKIEMNEDTALNRFQIIFSEAENMQRFMLIRNMRIMPLKGISFKVDMERQYVLIGYWMPLCRYSLKHLLKTQFAEISFQTKIRWSLQIIECLEVFYHEKIQHMDLKPQNILLDQNDDIVVSDLSMSKVFEKSQTQAFNMLGTTAKYAHPAAIVHHELSPRFDIYSFGVILLELFTGKQPWGNTRREDLKEIYTQILNNPQLMNPLSFHAENYPTEMKYISGKYKAIQEIIYMCCVSIFIKEKKDSVNIESIKLKFQELADTVSGDSQSMPIKNKEKFL